MKKYILLSVLMVSCGMISLAHALSLDIGDANYVGSVNDGIPSSLQAEAYYISTLVSLLPGTGNTLIGTETYNRVGSSILLTGLPTATDIGAFKQDNGTITFDATGFEYVLGKYDAKKAGSLVWYLSAGFIGEVTLPAFYNGQGLSHTSGFDTGISPPDPGPAPVPEPTTMLLFGAGLIGLAGLRRRKNK